MRKSKLVAVVLLACLLIVASFAGCGGNSGSSSSVSTTAAAAEATAASTAAAATSGSVSNITGEINFWYSANEANATDVYASWMKDNISLFQQKYPGVKVNPTIVTDGNQYLTKITTQMASGQGVPDIFQTWLTGRLQPFVTAGRVLALDDFVNSTPDLKNVMNPNAIKLSTFNGKFYAIPLIASGELIFYNKKLFADNGVSVPTTYDQLLAACKTFKDKGLIPMAVGDKDTWPGSMEYMALFNRIAGNDLYEQVVLNSKAKFDDPAFASAGVKLQEMLKAGCFTPNCTAVSYNDSCASFQNGKAAMIFDGTWSLSSYLKALGKDNLGFFNFPDLADEKGSSKDWLMNFDNGFALSSSSKNLPAAEAMMAFLFSNDRQAAYAEQGNLIACKNITMDTSKVAPIITDISNAWNSANYAIIPWDNPLGTNMGQEFNNTTQAILAGKDPAEVFKSLQKTAQQTWGN